MVMVVLVVKLKKVSVLYCPTTLLYTTIFLDVIRGEEQQVEDGNGEYLTYDD